ncbi:hypothetical protein [Sphingobium sp. RSMS]|uniref:hypothetical protein n=1 Tax=Sphingobium sp. RSMS TaxID=520734 RepID=UPI0021D3B94C|nr:hypothetical protein [Sphingobium sp. RSMS]
MKSLDRIGWLLPSAVPSGYPDGLVLVDGYDRSGRPTREVATMEKAAEYGAHAVFFEAAPDGGNGPAQAFVFVADGSEGAEEDFAGTHQRLWSWGGVPLVYRRSPGVVQLFRCGHKPDFAYKDDWFASPSTFCVSGRISPRLKLGGMRRAYAAARSGTIRRLLIAQSMVEGITLLTADDLVAQYPGPIRKI